MGKETEQRQPPDQIAEEQHARFALCLYHIPERERLVAEVVIDHVVRSRGSVPPANPQQPERAHTL